MAAAVIILTGLVLIVGVVIQAVREHRRTRYIDLRERLAPYEHAAR